MYQKMTSMAKKVGGPVNFLLLTATTGYVICRGCEAAVKKCVKKVQENKKHCADDKVYTVNVKGTSNENVEFDVGEQFVILESDRDAVLIKKIGDENNPYFVSRKLLGQISDYEVGK